MDYIGKCSCLYCKEVRSVRGIHTHVDRAHLGSTKYSSGNNGSYAKMTEDHAAKRNQAIAEYSKSPNRCNECDDVLPHEKRGNKYCGYSCSATASNRIRTENGWIPSPLPRKNDSGTLTDRKYVAPSKMTTLCSCGSAFEYYSNNPRTYCSRKCATTHSPKNIARRTRTRENRTALTN